VVTLSSFDGSKGSLMRRAEAAAKNNPFQGIDNDGLEVDSTVVTAWYRFESKHTYAAYEAWMKNFLTIKDALIIFTSSSEAQLVRRLRGPELMKRTVIVEENLRDCAMAQRYSREQWDAQLELDPENSYARHTVPLYWVWNEKVNYVQRAVAWNPFGSVYFAWSDVGSYRDEKWVGSTLMQNVDILDSRPGAVFFALVNVFDPHGEPDLFFSKTLVDHVSSTQFAGTADALMAWHDAYYASLDEYFKTDNFAGKTENVIARTCVFHPDLCAFVHSDDVTELWTSLRPIFAGKDQPFVIDLPPNLLEFSSSYKSAAGPSRW